MPFNKRFNGFTLIELVSIIVILAIVSIVAIPRFISMNTNAYQAGVRSVAAALNTASADNFAKRSANSTLGSPIGNCVTVGSLPGNLLPTGYVITSAAISSGAAVTCTVTAPDGQTAVFTGLGIS